MMTSRPLGSAAKDLPTAGRTHKATTAARTEPQAGEGPADGGSNPQGHGGGADGTADAGEGPADGGSNPQGHDGGADGTA